MPPRSEEELDAVTLHNQALINMDTKPSEGFEKLQFLLQQNPFPPETFANLLLLYCKYQYYDLAADVLAENVHLTYKYLTPVSLIFTIDHLFIKYQLEHLKWSFHVFCVPVFAYHIHRTHNKVVLSLKKVFDIN